ncbi:hypothetical protein ACJX0J_013430 [Zea mays]
MTHIHYIFQNVVAFAFLATSRCFSHFQPPLGIVVFVNLFDHIFGKLQGAHVVGWKRRKYRLQSISKDFSQDFHTCIEEGNRSIPHKTYHKSNHAIITSLLSSIKKIQSLSSAISRESFQIVMNPPEAPIEGP